MTTRNREPNKTKNKGGGAESSSDSASSPLSPATIPLSEDDCYSSFSGYRSPGFDDAESGEYGVILVNNNYHQQRQPATNAGDAVRGIDDGRHRAFVGTRSLKQQLQQQQQQQHPASFVDRLTQVCKALLVPDWLEKQTELCCGTNTSNLPAEGDCDKLLSDDLDESVVNRWSAHNMQREQDISLLTDVSLVTDGSLMDLVLSDRDEESIAKELMTNANTKANGGSPLPHDSGDLPAFRKHTPLSFFKRKDHERLVEQAVRELRQRREERERKEHLHPRLPHAVVPLQEEEKVKKSKRRKSKSGKGRDRQSKSGKGRDRQSKSGKGRDRQSKSGKGRDRQSKSGKGRDRQSNSAGANSSPPTITTTPPRPPRWTKSLRKGSSRVFKRKKDKDKESENRIQEGERNVVVIF